MKKFLEISTLTKICCVGGLVVGVTGLILDKLSKRRHINLPCTKESVTIFESYEPTKKYIGDIRKHFIQLENVDGFNRFFLNDTRVKIKLVGSNGNGILYMYARKLMDEQEEGEEDKWLVRRLDIQLAANNMRWKFYEFEPVEDDIETKPEEQST